MAKSLTIKPKFTVLSSKQKRIIHENSLKILSKVGIAVKSDAARDYYLKSPYVTYENGRIKIAPELAEESIRSAPKYIDIYDRLGKRAFRLGKEKKFERNNKAIFGTGVGNLKYHHPDKDTIEQITREDIAEGTRLTHSLGSYDSVSTLGYILDGDKRTNEMYGMLEMIANTTKPLVLLNMDSRQFEPILDLTQNLRGANLGENSLEKYPYVIPYFDMVSPLSMDENTGNRIIITIERFLPFIFSNYALAGGTTSLEIGDAIIDLNAELLGGLVLSQLIKKGTPLIMGSMLSFLDMKKGVEFYGENSFLANAACAEMMAFYEIPHAGTSGAGIGYGMGIKQAENYVLNMYTETTGKTGWAPFVGGSLGSSTFSSESLVYVDELIEQARRFAAGVPLDLGDRYLEELNDAIIRKNFMGAKSTHRLMRSDGYYTSKIFPRLNFDNWNNEGRPTEEEFLHWRTLEKIKTSKAPPDHDYIIEAGEKAIQEYVMKLEKRGLYITNGCK